MIVPGLNEIKGERWVLFCESGAVETDAGARILRRQADDDGPAHTIRNHGADGIRDVGLPVAHADVYTEAELMSEKVALFQRKLGQRRAADQAITVLDLFDDLWRQSAASGHTQKKFRDLVDRIRAAMGQEQDGSSRGIGGLLHVKTLNHKGHKGSQRKSLGILLHELRQGFHVFYRGFRQDAVSQIKDVSGAATSAAKNVFSARFQFGPAGKEQHRIEIALHGFPAA